MSKVEEFTPEAAQSLWSELADKNMTTAMVTVEYALRDGDRLLVHGEAHDQLGEGLAIGKSTQGKPFVISTIGRVGGGSDGRLLHRVIAQR